MDKPILRRTELPQWPMLFVYNIYRFISITLLFSLFWVDAYNHVSALIFCSALLLYLAFGFGFLYLWSIRTPHFRQQVLISGTVDSIVMIILISTMGYMQSGLGILLNALIAMLSILMPGRLAIFFAAVASCMQLAVSIFQYEYGSQQNLSSFFYTGIYGAGFFATALTAWYFANWVRKSENLAQARGRELESMQRLNEYIVGRLQYGVIYVGADGHIKLINHAAQTFFNQDRRHIHDKLSDLSPALYQKYKEFLVKKRNHKKRIHTLLDKPYLRVHFFPVSTQVRTAVLIILDEMAVIAQQAQQLKLASLGRFSASIAHELRNPLGVILYAIQLMGEKGLNAEDNRLKDLIINNCGRMNAVIQNVLQLSRRQQANPESIELTGFLKGFKHEFCLINQCDILLKIPQNKKKTVFFDKNQLEQILVILCDNAMQHGRDENGEVNICIAVEHIDSQMMITLCDKGPGISFSLRNDVFEPFFSTNTSGTGMGLFIAKDLCEINQANLSILDTSQGCCFAITLNAYDELEL